MAHFRATIQGSRGSASRLGGKRGIHASVNGWDCGVDVYAHYDEELGKDVIIVHKTRGSGPKHRGERELIATITEGEE